MKVILVLATVVLFQLQSTQQRSLPTLHKSSSRKSHLAAAAFPGEDDMCGDCVDFGMAYMTSLSHAVEESTVSKTCVDICSSVQVETHNTLAGSVCQSLCVKAGIASFLSAVNTSRGDPMYFCSLLLSCFDFGDCDASIASFNVTPSSIPQGGDYTITMIFKTSKGTGIGQIKMNFATADGVPMSRVYLVDPQVPGSRVFMWDGTAAPDNDCVKNCEQWIPGDYHIAVDIESCNGVCGPNNKVCDQSSASFTVIPKNI